MVMLLAEAGADASMALGSIETFTNLTAFGVLCLLVLHVFRHTIPRLADNFKTAIKEVSQTFREDSKEQRKVFTEELRAQRTDFKDFLMQHHEDISTLTESINELTQRIEEKLAS